ncbi:MAG: hypothetical protein LAT77_01400 [Aliidiomarina sp.]|uniref:hypothetical protein n=1 Tax=Aliidiomarina sp. TaxID=1872439 RepID=UPI0025B8EDF1|nr:hypothetical protein [Aliidiomarina sp.]MCH8500548.1 hypothetical protein [Aliidiomarina sp.]
MKMNSMRLLMPLSMLIVLAACSPSSDEQVIEVTENDQLSETTLSEQISDKAAEIFRLVGNPQADHPNQCRAIEFGRNACGGPASWLIYSTAVTDGETIEALVGEYNQLSETYQRTLGQVSDCAELAEIQLTIRDGICVGTALSYM